MIDAFNPPGFGSHGETRITRRSEKVSVCTFGYYAFKVWNELQAETHEHIFLKTGVISFGGLNKICGTKRLMSMELTMIILTMEWN